MAMAGSLRFHIVLVAASICASIALSLLALEDALGRGRARGSSLIQEPPMFRAPQFRGRTTALWDLEEGGPTDSDEGFNYNPVVLDDAVSRRGYPSLVTGWREWGCDGDKESLETEYECVNHPENHGADYDDDYWFDAYGKNGRFTGHFTEGLDI